MTSKVQLNEKSDKMNLNALNTSYYSVPRSCMCICFLSVSTIGSLLFVVLKWQQTPTCNPASSCLLK